MSAALEIISKPFRKLIRWTCLAVALAIVAYLFYVVSGERTPFDTDEADHANAGIELYRSSGLDIFKALTRQSFYPPVNSVFVAASFALLGPSIPASRLPSVLMFALHILIVAAAVRHFLKDIIPSTGDSNGITGLSSAVAALIAATSPIVFLNSALCMLEPLGILLSALLLLVLISYEKSAKVSVPTLALLGAILVLITLTKYSFGIFLIPALCLALFIGEPGKRWRLFEPLIVGAVWTTGMVIWLLNTDCRSAWHFIVGHPNYAPVFSAQHLLFYPTAWLSDYSASGVAATLSLMLATLGSYAFIRSLSVRFSVLAVLWTCFVLLVSTTDETRHLIIVAPLIWFLAALGFSRAIDSDFVAEHRPLAKLSPGIVCTFVLLIYLTSGAFRAGTIQAELRTIFEGDPTYSDLQEFLIQHIDANTPTLTIGTNDQFSLEGIRFQAARLGNIPYTAVRIDAFPFRESKALTAKMRRRNVDQPFLNPDFPRQPLEHVIQTGYYEQLVLVRRLGGSLQLTDQDRAFVVGLIGSMPKEVLRLGQVEVVVLKLQYEKGVRSHS